MSFNAAKALSMFQDIKTMMERGDMLFQSERYRHYRTIGTIGWIAPGWLEKRMNSSYFSKSSKRKIASAGLGLRSLVFRANRLFFESNWVKVWFALFKVWIAFIAHFVKSKSLSSLFLNEQQEQMPPFTKSKKSDSLFCFGHIKGKSTVKNEFEVNQKSESLFHKELIAHVTLYLKTTFYPVTLY